ncbi:hypothetical protein EG344_14915 [Chryseobacterium sp. G0162]|uniref:Uncharacterized protein n=1 Tax=Chryseobacterium nakagawai TaxID=1241982 RepID=A0AAD1DR15_CHRNA|nr:MULTISPECIES: hypothetical protein [Chryseobacterium]AZA90980.1 hypothetical protein EG343_10205 [Chryseobacterium nakagawai]AZB10011.1 hypothetical protein EG344_14915 [Chryseobacterium sp. G0162]VEH22524.1 Uncharacterised protein [Chryseobacterium nakagawai]
MALITLLIGLVLIYFKLSSKENVFNVKRYDDSMYDEMLYYRGWVVAVLLIVVSLAALFKNAIDFIA